MLALAAWLGGNPIGYRRLVPDFALGKARKAREDRPSRKGCYAFTRHELLAPPIVITVVAVLQRASDTIVSVRLGEAAAMAPRSVGYRHCQ